MFASRMTTCTKIRKLISVGSSVAVSHSYSYKNTAIFYQRYCQPHSATPNHGRTLKK